MPREARAIRNQALFREVNERIAGLEDGSTARRGTFVCECASVGCTERVTAPLETYRRVRDAGCFLVLPGHEDPLHEEVVDGHEGFAIVRSMSPIPTASAEGV